MAQFEYQIVEQAGGRATHLNDRLAQLVADGWEPIMMTGTSPQVSVLCRRAAGTGAQARPQGAAMVQPVAPTAPGAPAAPRPVAPTPPAQPV
jgi:hypothetical protein